MELLKSQRRLILNNEIYIVLMFFTLSWATSASFTSLYLYQVLNFTKAQVGIYGIIYFGTCVITSLFLPYILERTKEKRVLIGAALSLILVNSLFALNQVAILAYFLGIFLAIASWSRYETFNLIFRNQFTKDQLTKKEGLNFITMNLSWFLAPFIVSFFLYQYDVNQIFFLSAFYAFMALILFLATPVQDKNYANKVHDSLGQILHNTKDFFKDPTYRHFFLVASGIQVLMVFNIYLPVFIVEEHFSESVASTVVSFVFISILFMEFISPKILRRFDFKTTFRIAYLGPTILFTSAFFIANPYVQIFLIVLGMGIGYAFCEPIREIYFFTKTSDELEERYYPLYASCNVVGILTFMMLFSLYFSFGFATEYLLLLIPMLLLANQYSILKLEN